jgi:hypothetical protein
MVVIKLSCCRSCGDFVETKIKKREGEIHCDDLCGFCRKREKMIEKIKQKITDLEYKLYCLEDIQKF